MTTAPDRIEIRTRDLGDLAGAWDPDTRTIWLHHDLTGAEYRSTLAHELVHALRGDERCATHELNERQEALVDRIAATLLVPLDQLVDGLRWCYSDRELAEYLSVDLDTVRTRLTRLTDAETAYINARLDSIERAA